jgi:hypothetical protein
VPHPEALQLLAQGGAQAPPLPAALAPGPEFLYHLGWSSHAAGAGEPVFPRPLGQPLGDPRAPGPRGARRGTLRALGGALAPSAGPLCAAHLPPRVFTANSHGPRSHVRAPAEREPT